MIEIRHVLPPEEEHHFLVSPYNPWGVQESENLNRWLNLIAWAWSRGVFAYTIALSQAMREQGFSEEMISEIITKATTKLDMPDYRCKPQFHMLTGAPLPIPPDCN